MDKVETDREMAEICQQTFKRVHPLCKQMVNDHHEIGTNAYSLAEEIGSIFEESNARLRRLDPHLKLFYTLARHDGGKPATTPNTSTEPCPEHDIPLLSVYLERFYRISPVGRVFVWDEECPTCRRSGPAVDFDVLARHVL
jgi:hypothetical protein